VHVLPRVLQVRQQRRAALPAPAARPVVPQAAPELRAARRHDGGGEPDAVGGRGVVQGGQQQAGQPAPAPARLRGQVLHLRGPGQRLKDLQRLRRLRLEGGGGRGRRRPGAAAGGRAGRPPTMMERPCDECVLTL
jgi:hypothetical protein